MRERAQFVGFDLVVAVMVFVFLLFFLYQSWSSSAEQWEQLRQRVELEERGQAIAKILAESPGFPTDWNAADVNAIGLATQPNVLDLKKIGSFAAMDYNVARQKMNIGSLGFWLEIAAEKGPNPVVDHNAGVFPVSAREIFSVERRVLVGGESAVFRFQLFR